MAGHPSARDGDGVVIDWNLALGAAVLMASLALGALLSRWYVRPSGMHRAVPAGEETVPLAELFRPRAAEVNDIGWCPAEQAERLHAYTALGRQCWTCRTFTPTAAANDGSSS